MKYFYLLYIISYPSIAAITDYHPYDRTNEWFFVSSIELQKTEIQVLEGSELTPRKTTHSQFISEIIAKKINDKIFAGVMLNYNIIEQLPLQYGISDNSTYKRKGFAEPTFAVNIRTKTAKKEGDSNVDLYFSFTPSLIQRKTNHSNSNNFVGRNILKAGLTHQLSYTDWVYTFDGNYTYLTEGKEKASFSESSNINLNASSEAIARFEGRYNLSDFFWLKLGIGLRYIEETSFQIDNKKSTITQGTGTYHILGIMYQVNAKELWDFSLERFRNDYNVQGLESTTQGDYTQYSYILKFIHFI